MLRVPPTVYLDYYQLSGLAGVRFLEHTLVLSVPLTKFWLETSASVITPQRCTCGMIMIRFS